MKTKCPALNRMFTAVVTKAGARFQILLAHVGCYTGDSECSVWFSGN
jgi:hypothetical protein